MANPGDFAYTLKQQADIVRIVGEYVTLRKAGAQNFIGLCPFHQEKTPSMSVHASRQFFHCFGCGASGDVFSFVQKIENITFPEAVRLIADKLKIPMPRMSFSSPEEERTAKLRGGLLDIHERACTFFQEHLRRPEAAHAREYLASRGITPAVIAEFRMGFAPDSGFLLRDVLRAQWGEELLRESGLFSWKDKSQLPVVGGQLSDGADATSAPTTDNRQLTTIYSKFRNRVMFPICNETGKVIAFTGRTLATDEKAGPKYLNSPETPIYSKSRVLFNLDKAREAIRKLDYAVLVEGQMDCISVYTAGFRNVIASSGTAFTELQARLLARFSKNVVVNFDPDTAGAAAAERSLALLISEDFQIKVLTLETGFDPDLYIRRKGAAAYGEALSHSQKYFNYLIDRAAGQFPTRNAEGKIKAVNYLLPYVQKVPNRVAREELAYEISHRLDISSSLLLRDLRQAIVFRKITRVEDAVGPALTNNDKALIRALATKGLGSASVSGPEGADPEFDPARQVRFVLSRERLHSGLAAESLIDLLLSEEEVDPTSPLLDASQRDFLAAALRDKEPELTPFFLEGVVLSLRKQTLRRRLAELHHELKEAERRSDIATRVNLLAERIKLRRAMTAMGETA